MTAGKPVKAEGSIAAQRRTSSAMEARIEEGGDGSGSPAHEDCRTDAQEARCPQEPDYRGLTNRPFCSNGRCGKHQWRYES